MLRQYFFAMFCAMWELNAMESYGDNANFECFMLFAETNVSYTIRLCMIHSGIEIDCLTETIESSQAGPGKL